MGTLEMWGMKNKEKPDKGVLIGYVPLFYGEPTQSTSTSWTSLKGQLTKVQKHIEEIRDPKCCLWTGKNESFPVFGIEKAQETIKHLRWYSEDKPSEWFFLAINKQNPDHYDIALFPKFEKMLDRYKYQHLILAEEIITINDWRIIFRPIHFRSLNRGMIDKIPLERKMKVGVIDLDQINLKELQEGNFKNVPESEILGEFEVKVDDPSTESFFKGQ